MDAATLINMVYSLKKKNIKTVFSFGFFRHRSWTTDQHINVTKAINLSPLLPKKTKVNNVANS